MAFMFGSFAQGLADSLQKAQQARRQQEQEKLRLQLLQMQLQNLGQQSFQPTDFFGGNPLGGDLSMPTPVGGGVGELPDDRGSPPQQSGASGLLGSPVDPGAFSLAMQHTPEEQDRVASAIASRGGAQHWANFNPTLMADLKAAGLPTSGPVPPDKMGQFLDLVHKDESMGGKNVPNFRFDRTHTAGGVDQITNTTWREFAPLAGVGDGAPRTQPRQQAQQQERQQSVQDILTQAEPRYKELTGGSILQDVTDYSTKGMFGASDAVGRMMKASSDPQLKDAFSKADIIYGRSHPGRSVKDDVMGGTPISDILSAKMVGMGAPDTSPQARAAGAQALGLTNGLGRQVAPQSGLMEQGGAQQAQFSPNQPQGMTVPELNNRLQTRLREGQEKLARAMSQARTQKDREFIMQQYNSQLQILKTEYNSLRTEILTRQREGFSQQQQMERERFSQEQQTARMREQEKLQSGRDQEVFIDPQGGEHYLKKGSDIPSGWRKLQAGESGIGAGRGKDIETEISRLDRVWLKTHPDATQDEKDEQHFKNRLQAERGESEAKAAPARGMQSAVMRRFQVAHPDASDEDVADYALKYQRLSAIERSAGGGELGRQVRSVNTLATHIDLAREYAHALRTQDFKRFNYLLNGWSVETGNPEVTNFTAAGQVMADEFVKLLTGSGGGTIEDRTRMQALVNPNASPEQIDGALNVMTRLAQGRFSAMRQQFGAADPKREATFDRELLTPEAREIFTREMPRATDPQAQPTPGGGAKYSVGQTVTGPDGKQYRIRTLTPDGQPDDVDPAQ